MEWQDQGLVLAARRHGETAAIASLLTRAHGRHLGLVRGGQSRRRRGVLQAGNLVTAGWRARLAEHLGTFTVEPVHDFASRLFDDPLRLKGMAAALALLDAALAEREPHPGMFDETLGLMERLQEETAGPAGDPWLADYVRWELALLRCLGFGLELEACAATGSAENLAYVSPRTGRAVSAEAGAPYRGKLLVLPAFLAGGRAAVPEPEEIAAGLRLTGHFLDGHHFAAEGRAMPAARIRFVEALGK